AQLAEALLHLAHHARGVVEPLADGGLAALHQLEALAQAVVHLPREQSWLLADELPLTGERLAQLGTERVELLLEEEQRPGVVAQDAGPANLPSEHQERPAHHERRHHRPRLDRHHPLPARASSTRGRSRSRAAARASAAGRYAPAARAPARPPAPPAPPGFLSRIAAVPHANPTTTRSARQGVNASNQRLVAPENRGGIEISHFLAAYQRLNHEAVAQLEGRLVQILVRAVGAFWSGNPRGSASPSSGNTPASRRFRSACRSAAWSLPTGTPPKNRSTKSLSRSRSELTGSEASRGLEVPYQVVVVPSCGVPANSYDPGGNSSVS